MTAAAEFERARRLHQQGKLREAFLRYDAIIEAEPQHAGALYFSGVVLHQAGKHAEAITRIRASLAIDPNVPDAWSNLALALEAVDRREAAINALQSTSKPRSCGSRPRKAMPRCFKTHQVTSFRSKYEAGSKTSS